MYNIHMQVLVCRQVPKCIEYVRGIRTDDSPTNYISDECGDLVLAVLTYTS